MTQLQCANPTCAVPGRHATGCDNPADCRGCQPALARDGLWLCGRCTDHIGTDATRAAELHGELALVLAGTGSGGGPRVSGGGLAAGIALNEAAVTARTQIESVLGSWCRMIAEERGLSAPAPHITALGAYIHLHREWLAAHGAAADACGEIRGLVTLARPIAQPSGTRSIHIGACPGRDEPCDGKLRARLRGEASLLPHTVTCDEDETHSWTADQWRTLGRRMEAGKTA